MPLGYKNNKVTNDSLNIRGTVGSVPSKMSHMPTGKKRADSYEHRTRIDNPRGSVGNIDELALQRKYASGLNTAKSTTSKNVTKLLKKNNKTHGNIKTINKSLINAAKK